MMCYALFRNEPHFINISAGSTLYSEGDPPGLMHVLIVGEARITLGGDEIERLRPGDVVGEMSLIDDQPHSVAVEAITDCEFACVDEDRFNFLVAETPGFALEIMQVLTRRLRATDRLLAAQRNPRGSAKGAPTPEEAAAPVSPPPQAH
jgi:CRP/FNR family cyclic AMP-dependent transcriptional regulator